MIQLQGEGPLDSHMQEGHRERAVKGVEDQGEGVQWEAGRRRHLHKEQYQNNNGGDKSSLQGGEFIQIRTFREWGS